MFNCGDDDEINIILEKPAKEQKINVENIDKIDKWSLSKKSK